MNRLNILVVLVLAVVMCSCGGPASRMIFKPTDADVRAVFADIEVTLPPITNAISVERFEGLKGNTLTLTIPDQPESTNALMTAFGSTNWNRPFVTIPSRTDKAYPWQFAFECNVHSNGVKVVVITGMQPYD